MVLSVHLELERVVLASLPSPACPQCVVALASLPSMRSGPRQLALNAQCVSLPSMRSGPRQLALNALWPACPHCTLGLAWLDLVLEIRNQV